MWNKIKQFYWTITDWIRFIKVGFEVIREHDSPMEEKITISDMQIAVLKKYQKEAFKSVFGKDK